MIRNFSGWSIYHNPSGPVTGQYLAYRWGIRMGANTQEMLISMIQSKCDKFTPGGCHKDCCNERGE
jgi:hypothetical protein